MRSRLYYLYSKHAHTRSRTISDGDIINGAFAIAEGCPILTIDNTDYPRVFFAETNRHRVTYISKRSKKEATDILYSLQPDMAKIKECFEEHNA